MTLTHKRYAITIQRRSTRRNCIFRESWRRVVSTRCRFSRKSFVKTHGSIRWHNQNRPLAHIGGINLAFIRIRTINKFPCWKKIVLIWRLISFYILSCGWAKPRFTFYEQLFKWNLFENRNAFKYTHRASAFGYGK